MNLKKKAADIVKLYTNNAKVDSVLIGGSVSKNWHDKYSDIEVFVFWKEAPTDRDRKQPIHELAGNIIDYYPYEDEEWSETYITDGIKIEISNFLTDTIHKIIDDVVVSFDTDTVKQSIAATVYHGMSSANDIVISQLKEKVAVYPLGLSIVVLEESIHLGNMWNNREALLERRDWLMFYKMITEVQTNMMKMLFGLNRQYVHHPAFKWQQQSLEVMRLVPHNISHRLPAIFLMKPEDSIKELEALLEELYALIQSNLPEIDLSSVIQKHNL